MRNRAGQPGTDAVGLGKVHDTGAGQLADSARHAAQRGGARVSGGKQAKQDESIGTGRHEPLGHGPFRVTGLA